MTEERSHQFIHEAELAERYVAGRMPDAERVAFEDHFVVCGECQRDVRFAGAVRAELAASAGRRAAATEVAAMTSASAAGRAQRRSWRAAAAIATGIAAGIAVMIIRTAPPSAIIALGAVAEAPAYAGIAVRSEAGHGETAFESAMQEYAAGHYAASGQGLRVALAAGEDSVPTEFFIGASFLLAGDSRSAAAAFARVVAKGDSPYRDEARWYQAKALLRLGRAKEALSALTARASADPAMAARLSALADSVQQADTR